MPEIQLYSGLTARPVFVPSVGNFRQGMLVSVPLHLDALPAKPTLADLKAASRSTTPAAGISGCSRRQTTRGFEPEALNGTNDIEIHVFGSEARRHAALVAEVRQPRQGRLGRGGAEFDADAGALTAAEFTAKTTKKD